MMRMTGMMQKSLTKTIFLDDYEESDDDLLDDYEESDDDLPDDYEDADDDLFGEEEGYDDLDAYGYEEDDEDDEVINPRDLFHSRR